MPALTSLHLLVLPPTNQWCKISRRSYGNNLKQLQHCSDRLQKTMGEQCQKVSLASAAKRFKWTTAIAALKKDATLGMASDW
eukprot:5072326-Prorocentrum_lima.AAC.1